MRFKRPWARFFYAFSLSRNWKRIFIEEYTNTEFRILNGIRVFALWWIILGEVYIYSSRYGVSDPNLIIEIMKEFLSLIVSSASFALDIFYLVSAFLSAYILAEGYIKLQNGKGRFLLLALLRRWYRLAPTLYVTTGFGAVLFKYFGGGPLWPTNMERWVLSQCRRYWWTNFVFVNNLVPWNGEDQCLDWLWFVANELQFFLLAIVSVVLFCVRPRLAYTLNFLLVLACIAHQKYPF